MLVDALGHCLIAWWYAAAWLGARLSRGFHGLAEGGHGRLTRGSKNRMLSRRVPQEAAPHADRLCLRDSRPLHHRISWRACGHRGGNRSESRGGAHYHECFVRDFVPSALVFLLDGRTDFVRNFLTTVIKLRGLQPVPEGHHRSMGLMPASQSIPDLDRNGLYHCPQDHGGPRSVTSV